MRHPLGLARRHGVSDIQFSEFRPQTRAFPCDSPFELARDRFEGRADGTHAWPADPHQAGTGFNSLRGLNSEPVESRVASALGPGCIPRCLRGTTLRAPYLLE